MYEDEREAVRHGAVEALCQHGATETYGTIMDGFRGTVRPDEQG